MLTGKVTEFLLARIAEDAAVASHGDGGILDHEDAWFAKSRMLAECEAKRRIVEARPLPVGHTWDMIRAWHDTALKNLATVYADHPDYDEAWRP